MNFVISVINPNMSARLGSMCAELELPLCIELLGKGTATKSTLDILGLRARDYHVLITVANKEKTAEFIEEARRQLYIDAPGHGIVVATPIKSVGGGKTLSYLNAGSPDNGAPDINFDFELILAIANEGYTDLVMDAAREAGARGGTVLHGKGTGSKDAEKFFKVSIASEKEVVMIVARSYKKAAIMKSIINKAGMNTEAKAVVMSLPVSSVAGFGMLDDKQ